MLKTLKLESEIVESGEVIEKKRRHYLFVVGWVAKYLTSRSQAIAEFENPLHNCNHELAVIHLDCSSERLLSASFRLPLPIFTCIATVNASWSSPTDFLPKIDHCTETFSQLTCFLFSPPGFHLDCSSEHLLSSRIPSPEFTCIATVNTS